MLTRNHILVAAALLFLVTCWFSIGYGHGDEHFQIYEFAGRLLGWNTGEDMAWEFRQQMRPTLQPILTAGGILAFNAVSITDPFVQSFIFRLFSAALLFYSLFTFLKAFNLTQNKQALLVLFFFSLSPYLAARYSSEGISASCLLLLIARLHTAASVKDYLIAGLFAGLAFAFRFQLAFALVGTALWYALNKRFNWKEVLAYGGGFIFIFLISVFCDRYFYGTWVLAPYEYFYQNIVLNKASNYGTDPWWYYFRQILKYSLFIPGLIAILLVCWYAFKNKKDLIVLVVFFFWLGHAAVAHKEGRFLFPVAIPFAFLVLQSLSLIAHPAYRKAVLVILVIGNLSALIPNVLLPASHEISVLKFLEKKYPPEHFTIYYDGQSNPYENWGLYNKFYTKKRPRFIAQEEFSEDLLSQPSVWISYSCKEEGKEIGSTRLKRIYQVYPEWITDKISFNNVILSGNVLTVYEMVPLE